MATADHDSSSQLEVPPLEGAGAVAGGGEVWLDGDVLACACPDCGSPMSIRLWLGVADCWRCGASIELSPEQQRQAHELWEAHQTRQRQSTPAPPVPAPPADAAPVRGIVRRRAAATPPNNPPPLPPAPSQAAPQAAQPATPPIPPRPPARRRWLAAELLKNLPAWLVSFVVHMIAMLLMALWTISTPREPIAITLATSASPHLDLPGELGEESTPMAVEFDDPGVVDLSDVLEPETRVQAPLDLPALHAPPPPELEGVLPTPADVMALAPGTAGANLPLGDLLAGRDPRARAQLVERQGGTSETEAAVARGLVWLARHQMADGSWSLHRWNRAPGAKRDERLDGYPTNSDTAATAMALLPFLGAGQTPRSGEHAKVVHRGLKWLVAHQGRNGDLRGEGAGQMYAHGQAAIALTEAYAMTRDDWLRQPAQKSLDFIVRAQHSAGGWRYQPGDAGDTSVVGWQLIALRSGRMFYLHVPQETFERAARFLDTVQSDDVGGKYSYQAGGGPTPTMTAEALLCRQYLGWPQNHAGLDSGVRFLSVAAPPDAGEPNVYYWYYATQVMHHMGGSPWRQWNARMSEILVGTQEKHGPMAGSWEPRGPWSAQGGRIMMTALSVCILEVYYRHMPMYDVSEALIAHREPPWPGSKSEAAAQAAEKAAPPAGQPQTPLPGLEALELE